MRKTPVLYGVLVLLLVISLGWASFEHNNVSSLQYEINRRDETIVDRDTLITQLDTAIQLAESELKLKPPSDSQYLKTVPDQNNEGEITKIFLNHTAPSYSYRPDYPFNATLNGSSLKTFELTENRSIKLSFWGWWFNMGRDLYGGVTGGGVPALNIGVTVRNDYTSADLGAPIGNRTGSYVSSIILDIRFYSWNGSIVEISKAKGVIAPTASSNTATGGAPFLLPSGQTKQVIFYLSPTASDIDAIDHYEIYVSSASAY